MILKSYLNDLISAYNTARNTQESLAKSLEQIEEKWEKARKGNDLTASGKEKARIAYQAEKAQLNSSLESNLVNFESNAAVIREKVDKEFSTVYEVSAEHLDMAAVEILKSGILTPKEMTAFTEKYKGNYTMLRYIGKTVNDMIKVNPGNKELKQLNLSLSNMEAAPHLVAVDTLIMWSTKALGTDIHNADVYAELFSDNANNIISEYGNISSL